MTPSSERAKHTYEWCMGAGVFSPLESLFREQCWPCNHEKHQTFSTKLKSLVQWRQRKPTMLFLFLSLPNVGNTHAIKMTVKNTRTWTDTFNSFWHWRFFLFFSFFFVVHICGRHIFGPILHFSLFKGLVQYSEIKMDSLEQQQCKYLKFRLLLEIRAFRMLPFYLSYRYTASSKH